MKNKIILTVIAIILIGAVYFFFSSSKNSTQAVSYKKMTPERKDISLIISTTGQILPQNRLEITPTISGRVDAILIQEGDYVRAGQTIARMSSDERAALIDSARSQGKSAVAYWEDIYKPISVIAPINGTVIVRNVEPGQSVNTNGIMFVLSDRLIVKASVDETDIGSVKKGQQASISLDAYPDVNIEGTVNHIYYESATVNNVVIYYVDILPRTVPEVFRSGMSANINIVKQSKKNLLTVPYEAVKSEGALKYVLIPDEKPGNKDKKNPHKKQYVTTGLIDDTSIEIVEGLSDDSVFLMEVDSQFAEGADDNKKNPFMPQRKNNRK